MSTHTSPTLMRLADSNPVVVDDELGRGSAAQTALTHILASERAGTRRPLARRTPRVLLAAAVALLLAVGGALAATDPFGLFRSPNPGTAIFGVDTNRHVQPPSEQVISCPSSNDPVFRCATGQTGQRYQLLEHVEQNVPAGFGRNTLTAGVQQALRGGIITKATAQRIDADLNAVSEDFLTRLGVMLSYSTLSTGNSSGRVPPAGIPELIVCEASGVALTCRDLNGDTHATIGSGIYAATPAADWVPAPPHRSDPSRGLEVAILGRPPSAAELRVIRDLAMAVTGATKSSAPPRQPQRAPATPASP